MHFDDLILVSVDDHIIEPPDLFARHIPKQWAGREPRLIFDPAARTQSWTWEGGKSTTTFINAVVTLPKQEWGFDPSLLSEIRPGCFDVAERVRDMDANGVLASMCFPSFAGMAGNFFAACADKQLALACLRAYNDYINEWRKTQRPCGEDVEAEAQAESDRLEAEYTKHILAELIQSGGLSGGPALPPATTSEISPT